MKNEGKKSEEKIIRESVWLRGKMIEISRVAQEFSPRPTIRGDFGVSLHME